MAEFWPPPRYTVLRVTEKAHRAELVGDEDDDLEPDYEADWRESWRPALAFAHAYGEEDADGNSAVVMFVPWRGKSP